MVRDYTTPHEGDDEARAFLRQALKLSGVSAYRLAEKAGVAASTITRPLNNPDFKFTPKQATLAKIAKAVGLTPPQLPEPTLHVELISRQVPLVGEVQAGVWTEIPENPRVEETVAVHLPEYDGAELFAVRVRGRSMDLHYQEGTVVICSSPVDVGVRVGDVIVVRRRQGALYETTLKQIERGEDGGYVLHPRSSDPSFQPIPLPRRRDDDEGPQVIGVVLYAINPQRTGDGPLVTLDE